MKKLLNVIKKIICVFGGIILILVIQISICIWRHHGRGIEKRRKCRGTDRRRTETGRGDSL